MPDEPGPENTENPEAAAEAAGDDLLRCDFCGEPSANVRRVALDRDYDRLQTRHQVRYACDLCSDKKEQQRLGLR